MRRGKEVRTLMRFTMIPVLGLMLALSASPAFAFGGGGGHSDAVSGGVVRSSKTSSPGGSSGGGSVASTSEPLALFAVGIGLLGARYLRRKYTRLPSHVRRRLARPRFSLPAP